MLVLSSKSLSPSHNDTKVVNFFHPDFSTPSHRAESLGWEKGLMQAGWDERQSGKKSSGLESHWNKNWGVCIVKMH
jgi:hypothetical protein